MLIFDIDDDDVSCRLCERKIDTGNRFLTTYVALFQ